MVVIVTTIPRYELDDDLSKLFKSKRKYLHAAFRLQGENVVFTELKQTRRRIFGRDESTVEIVKVMVRIQHRNKKVFNTLVSSLQKSFPEHVIRVESANTTFSTYLRDSKTPWSETGPGDFVTNLKVQPTDSELAQAILSPT